MNTSPEARDLGVKEPGNRRAVPWIAAAVAAVLLIAFGRTLVDVVKFSLSTELFSHIILVPFVSGYLIWIKRPSWPVPSAPSYGIAGGLAGLGLCLWITYGIAIIRGVVFSEQDRLSLLMAALVLLVTGLVAGVVGRRTLRHIAFPLAFLIFLVPFPTGWVDGIESFLQHASAKAAAGFFSVSGMTYFREDTFFQLPGINLEVAPECSGIRSSLALFITSVVAGHLFLRSYPKRVVLALAVVPLAILRNGLRIFVIGELCVRVSPDMINSYIHRQGGPIFFALSLVPFSLLLWFLLRRDHSRNARKTGG